MQFIKSASLVSVIVLAAAAAACSSSTPSNPVSDGGATDAKKDTATVQDTGTGTDSGGGSCKPGDVTAFAPTGPHDSAAAKPGTCTQVQIDDYVGKCYDKLTKDTTACTAWAKDALNKVCLTCADTQESAAKWGPLVEKTGIISANIVGCFAAKGDTACATALANADQCGEAACSENCPVSDDPSFQLYQACRNKAAGTGGGCNKYTAPSNDCEGADSANAAACIGDDFAGTAKLLIAAFCK